MILFTLDVLFFHFYLAESLYECTRGGGWVNQGLGPGPGPGAEAALREAASLPLERWRAPAVRAWLDLALGMPPQYGAKCAENIKSGKVCKFTLNNK